MLRILADENIPFVRQAFESFGATVRMRPGRAIQREEVQQADVLLVRSVTPVNRAVLEGSRVQFVGSATIGTDHVDQDYLRSRGIGFAHAPGSNADSVVEYVLAALLRLAVRRQRPLRGKTVGVVGCGNIGGRLAKRLPSLGVRVLKNDPPRAEEEAGHAHDFVSLERVLAEADIVTLHVPLTRTGPHPTYHLFDEAMLRQLREGAWLLNTSRGPVVDNAALRRVLEEGPLSVAVLDVWESEPTPTPELVQRVALATPHIAGYSFDGKVQGTIMLYRALAEHLGVSPDWDYEAVLAPMAEDQLTLTPPDPALPETDALHWLARQMYDIGADDRRLREMLEQPPDERGAYFSELRKTYPRRRSFDRHRLPAWGVPAAAYREAVTRGLKPQITSYDKATRAVR